MNSTDVIDLSSDDDNEVDVKPVKMELDLFVRPVQPKKEHRSRSGTSVLDQEHSPVDDSENCSTSPICSAPIIRQFWKAGNYEDGFRPKSTHKLGTSYLHINPRFLHSNATSHKWAFGAIAELLDNAVDEIQNGATFVIVDKTVNPRNGSSALLIQDDGGGMDPDAMRRCLSFGFSNKKSKSAIGQYGNGFKTSSMRLGADAIVFSRHSKSTQSIGLLSYTFLTQTGHDRIVVPMVDYKFDTSTGTSNPLSLHNKESFFSNLSILLQWSPYQTERDLLKQFDEIGKHGTKVIIYNLWFNEEQSTELDFESDPKDIIIRGGKKNTELVGLRKMIKAVHLADRLRYSLRAYLSVLYLRLPPTFCILLRGQVIEYHNIATELKFPEFIMYKPQSGGRVEGDVLTTIGFLKEAPNVNIHGFNVYHKNRLILPFWPVVIASNSIARGVVGVLEANFIEPTHNKQDFEKTSVFQKLETRLKQMALEYWDYHCGLLGYHQIKKPKRCSDSATSTAGVGSFHPPPVPLSKPVQLPQEPETIFKQGVHAKRKAYDHVTEPDKVKSDPTHQVQTFAVPVENVLVNEETLVFVKENEKLLAECLAYDKREEELKIKVNELRQELMDAEGEHTRLLSELECIKQIKNERDV